VFIETVYNSFMDTCSSCKIHGVECLECNNLDRFGRKLSWLNVRNSGRCSKGIKESLNKTHFR
jgi:hypothetical protein